MFPGYLRIAVDIAARERFRDGRGYSLAAVGEREDGVLVRAINGWSMCGVEPSMHAEARVLRKGASTVFVARVRKDGSVGCARPCVACQLMLRYSKCYYTISDNEWGCIA